MRALDNMSEISKKSSKKLILIDGYGFVFRAYHALARANMKRADGTPVGAVFAFTNMLIKTIKDHETDYIAVVFDSGEKTFRNDIYKEYKANRPPAPEDLIPQFPLVREAAKALNLAIVEKIGYEADDLIATYTKIAKEHGYEVIIISSDKDLMQLIGDGVQMYDSLKSRIIDVRQVEEKFGVKPDKVLDVLSLMGDSSDNVPGVPGIGPKTASELINRFGTLENVLESTSEITQNKRRETLEASKQQALLSKELIKLCYDVPVESEIEDFVVKDINNENLLIFLREQGFKSLIAKFDKDGVGDNNAANNDNLGKKTSSELLKNVKDISKWLNKQGEIRALSIDVINDEKTSDLLGVSFCVEGKSCFFRFEVEKQPSQTSLFGDDNDNKADKIGINEVIKEVKAYLEDKSILKVGHSLKRFIQEAKECGVEVQPFDDVMIMSSTLEGGLHKHDIKNMIVRHYPEIEGDFVDIKISSDMEDGKIMHHSCLISGALLYIHKTLKAKLIKERQTAAYYRIEKPLVNVLGQMESNGIKVDVAVLNKLSGEFAKQAAELELEIHKMAGCEFNIGSPKQLGEVLFEQMGLSTGKKSKKSGAYSTDVQVLQALAADGHDIADKVLQWRHISKMKSTYTDSLPKQVKEDGRVHTTFEMAATSTGRLSSRDPNLQNIPIRTEDGSKIRRAFVAKEGCKLISADYSQIELRLLAHMADMPVLQDAFNNNLDIHAATASQMFKVDLKDVDSDLRRKAKTINFGIIYGISAFGLSQRLGIPRGEAAKYIKQYFEQYPGIEAYMKKTVEFAREHSYVETIWGRKCFVNGINDKNPALRQFSERAAINAPLQGSAADIIKKAMVCLNDEIAEKSYKASILLQVHDELLIEVAENEAEKIAKLTKDIMENAVSISVPALVDVNIGNNWNEIH
ncbi:MAG: DNA polymerase I [Rickettsiales bacterium]|nr:DNA polymerase I [Pseudomonadota bacterium]MDA0965343.1 DNA polymerase I [Pseudomonadota bacterium]MDG4544448.1 DNA polymerase I [Rickettsiales bacterium]MDG4546578.1 DNA polymerase I [Rickettsiales bacterium]MDG4548749.1 DNA polymerase I [Rickettsiales bacterium]